MLGLGSANSSGLSLSGINNSGIPTLGLGLGTGTGLNSSQQPTSNTLSLGLGANTASNTSMLGLAAIASTTNNQSQTVNTSTVSTSSTATTITFKILEDYINKWMSELDSQEKDFLNQATQLNALDKLMIENGDKVVILSNF